MQDSRSRARVRQGEAERARRHEEEKVQVRRHERVGRTNDGADEALAQWPEVGWGAFADGARESWCRYETVRLHENNK